MRAESTDDEQQQQQQRKNMNIPLFIIALYVHKTNK